MNDVIAAASLALAFVAGACSVEGDGSGHAAKESSPQDSVDPAPSSEPSHFCSTVVDPIFCSDFEGERPFAGWLNAEKQPNPGEFGGGTITPFASGDPAHAAVARFMSP